ncbi:MAG TPA: rod shape-determining protein MreC [Chitinophaga sp.]|uniref:rod shape-determining protein MreC n=1 Tax=Chitinophaga sp. TaxID=1869181 RepID=UPI002DB6C99A|nr:rod shape-determining protein MreC [Chitinophaga sp.]HEU4553277.1 rod shape-determining protein MreC [Chitinophaga sp.]
MRNLVIFLRRYFNFFLFLLLEVICIVLVFRNNNFQKTAYLNSANNLSGKLYDRYNNVQYYFHLKATNDSLVAENARLHNMLRTNYDSMDTTSSVVTDTIRHFSTDTTHRLMGTELRRYIYLEAKVINNSVNRPVNYITIHRGRKQGIRPNMGVVSPTGVVGMVRSVSDNYAVVLSILAKSSGAATSNFGVSARLLKGKEIGTVYWDGANPGYAIMRDIPRSVRIQKGDTVITSGFSALFPENIPVGYIEDFALQDKSSTSYSIRIKLATNFYNLQYVYVIDNLLKEEQQQLEDSTYRLTK